MSQLSLLLGNKGIKTELQQLLAENRLGHALLMTAPKGCGLSFAAHCLAADFLFPQGGPATEAVLRDESSEVLLLQGEGKSGQISVESVRGVRSSIYQSALSSAGRVVLVLDAHRMAPPAYNALLKVLEEPPEGVLFILCGPDASTIPLTIRSRCTWLPVSPLPIQECEQVLLQRFSSVPADKARLLAVAYAGRLGLCLSALQDEACMAVLQDALDLMREAAAASGYQVLRILSAYEGRADGDREKREVLLETLCDCLSVSMREGRAPGFPVILAADAARLLPYVQQTIVALRGNVSPKIAFTSLAVYLLRTARLHRLAG
ncbi:MAG: hypothetical protein ACK5JF_06485 [Oscillospiraceae bacterium]